MFHFPKASSYQQIITVRRETLKRILNSVCLLHFLSKIGVCTFLRHSYDIDIQDVSWVNGLIFV